MKLTMTDFATLKHPVDVTIRSLDKGLYQVTAMVDGKEALVAEDTGNVYRSGNLQQIREVLELLPVASITLRQESAYEDRAEQPPRARTTPLEMLFSLNLAPTGTLHGTNA